MGKLNRFEISLNQGVYFPGQLLQGIVTVELNQEMKMRGIRLHFYGGAYVSWTERHSTGSGKNRKTVTRHYSASETYFNYELVLFGKASGASGDNPTLAAGRHEYPFHYQLPEGIPSSFEGGVGRIRYFLTGVIDKPWKFNHTTKIAFTINSPVDLNAMPGVMNGVQGEGNKTLCCLCCKSGPISCVFQLERTGYVPGEYIPITGEIYNQSRRKMKRSLAQLYMVVVFHATTKSRSNILKVSEISRGEIPPGHSDVWDGQPLHIPPVPPSELSGCRIIVIDYFVKMCVDPSGPAFNLEIPLKVTIGSIPLRQTLMQYGYGSPGRIQDQYQPSGPPSAPPSAPGTTHIQTATNLPSVPPPSYEASVFGVVDIRDEDDSEFVKGNMQYAPMYTYYDIFRNDKPSSPRK